MIANINEANKTRRHDFKMHVVALKIRQMYSP